MQTIPCNLDDRATCTELFKLAVQLDEYLRQIRAENLDGSEPALGRLLDKAHDLLTPIWDQEGFNPSDIPSCVD